MQFFVLMTYIRYGPLYFWGRGGGNGQSPKKIPAQESSDNNIVESEPHKRQIWNKLKKTTTTKKQNILLNKLMLEKKNTCSEPPTPPPLENIMVYPYMSLSRYFTEITSRSQSRKKGLRVLDLQLIPHYIISTQKLTSNEGYSLDVPANSHN